MIYLLQQYIPFIIIAAFTIGTLFFLKLMFDNIKDKKNSIFVKGMHIIVAISVIILIGLAWKSLFY